MTAKQLVHIRYEEPINYVTHCCSLGIVYMESHKECNPLVASGSIFDDTLHSQFEITKGRGDRPMFSAAAV